MLFTATSAIMLLWHIKFANYHQQSAACHALLSQFGHVHESIHDFRMELGSDRNVSYLIAALTAAVRLSNLVKGIHSVHKGFDRTGFTHIPWAAGFPGSQLAAPINTFLPEVMQARKIRIADRFGEGCRRV